MAAANAEIRRLIDEKRGSLLVARQAQPSAPKSGSEGQTSPIPHTTPPDEPTDLPILGDRPETERDYLGRSDVAFILV